MLHWLQRGFEVLKKLYFGTLVITSSYCFAEITHKIRNSYKTLALKKGTTWRLEKTNFYEKQCLPVIKWKKHLASCTNKTGMHSCFKRFVSRFLLSKKACCTLRSI